MATRPRILVLGVNRWQVPLVVRAQALGYFVVGTDVDRTASGFAHCDVGELMDVRDVEGNLLLAKRHRVDAVVSGVDLAIPTVAAVSRRLGLRALSPQQADWTTNKLAMRTRVSELGLSDLRFAAVRSATEASAAADEIGYPCVVKPADNCGSRGVSVVSDAAGVAAAYEAAGLASFGGTVLVEQLMTGEESSVEGWVDDTGELHVLGISKKKKSPLPFRFDLQLNYPADFPAARLREITEYAKSLVRGFGLDHGLVHIELMVAPDRVRLIEAAARGCGGFVIGKLIPAMTGADPLGHYLKQALGEKPPAPVLGSRHGLLKFIMGQPGKLQSITGLREASEVPGIVDIGLDVRPGQEIAAARDTTGRWGYLLAVGDGEADLARASDEALARLRLEIAPPRTA